MSGVYHGNINASDAKQLIGTNKIPKQYPFPGRGNICEILCSLQGDNDIRTAV